MHSLYIRLEDLTEKLQARIIEYTELIIYFAPLTSMERSRRDTHVHGKLWEEGYIGLPM